MEALVLSTWISSALMVISSVAAYQLYPDQGLEGWSKRWGVCGGGGRGGFV